MSIVILSSGGASTSTPPAPGAFLPPSVLQYTAEEMTSYIRIRAGLASPTSEGSKDTDILGYINGEALGFAAELLQGHEEYFVVTDRVAMAQRMPIPHRALFRKLRDVIGVDSAGCPYVLNMLNREDYPWRIQVSGCATECFVEGNYLTLAAPRSFSGGFVDMAYYFRPGQLVLSTECRRVLSVNTTTGVIGLESAVPTTWTTLRRYDFHSMRSGAEPKNWSIAASLVSGSNVTFPAADIDGTRPFRYPVEVGDWMCLEEQAALPGIPREMHPILAQKVICRFLEKKDRAAYEVSRNELTYMLKQVMAVLNNRVEGRPEHISACASGSIFFPV